jgi:hypothetical protein
VINTARFSFETIVVPGLTCENGQSIRKESVTGLLV